LTRYRPVSVVLFLGHLWLSLIMPSTRRALSGITRGWVHEDWAARRHPNWVESMRAED
jgi:cytochrome b subunit of formate dehydrogenase